MVKNSIIFLLLLFILFLSLCNSKREVKEESSILYITDTLTQFIEVPKVEVKYIREEKSTIAPKRILSDSNELSKDLRVFYYNQKDSLLNSSILVHSYDRPERVEFLYDFKQMTIKDSVYNERVINKNKLFIGGSVAVSPLMSTVNLGLSFYQKRGHLFEGSVGYDLQGNHSVISVGYKREL